MSSVFYMPTTPTQNQIGVMKVAITHVTWHMHDIVWTGVYQALFLLPPN